MYSPCLCTFGEYFGNLVGEILDNHGQIENPCPVGLNREWWHTSSCHNAADQATHSDSSPLDVNHTSKWQQNPEYLKDDPSHWPIIRDFATYKEDCIPNSELLKLFCGLIQKTDAICLTGIHQLICPWSTNFWCKLLGRTQKLLQWYCKVHIPNSTSTQSLQPAHFA